MAAKPRKSEEPPPSSSSSIEQEEEEESTPLTKPTGTSVATPISTSTDDGFKQETDSTPRSNADASSQENEEETTEKPKPSNILANANGSEATTKKKKNKRKSEPGEDANAKKKKKNKSAFSKRVWSDADEVELLSGMANFIEKEGRNPSTHLDEFLASIKNSLGFDVSATQLYDKMRRLKKRYLDNRERLSKNGDYPSFANPHEQELYELSKMIWGTGVNVSSGGKKNKKRTGDGGVSKAIDDGKKRKRNRRKTSDEVVTSTTSEQEEEEEEEKDLSKYPCLNMMAEEGKDMLAIPNVVLEKYLSKEGFSLLSSAQKKVLDLKWEIRQDEEADIYYRKLELARQMERELNDAIVSKRHNQKTDS